MIKKVLFSLLAIFTCILPVHATSIPKQDSSIYVNDYADVLSDNTEKTLVSLNQDADYKTGGYVVVATFDFVDDDLYDFSYKLFNQWGVGDEDNDNGVLLVLDIGNDNYCYIMGTGIEKVLSDSEARSIIDSYMEPDFAKQDYDNAVLKTTKQFLNVIENGDFEVEDSVVIDSGNKGLNFNIGGILKVGFVVLFIIILIVAAMSTPKRGGGYHRRYRGAPPPPPHHRPMGGPGPMGRPGGMGGMSRSKPSSRPSGGTRGFGGSRSGGGSHHSGGSSRGAGGTRH